MSETGRSRWSPAFGLAVALVTAIGLLAVFGVVVSLYGWNHDAYGMMSGGSWWMWASLMMGVPAAILLVILLTVLSGLRETGPAPSAAVPPDPVRLLSERYARGELGREEFLRARGDLIGVPERP